MSATRRLVARLAAMGRRVARRGFVVRRPFASFDRAAFATSRRPDAMAPVDHRRGESIAGNDGMRSATPAH
jgi:hypothetical protein